MSTQLSLIQLLVVMRGVRNVFGGDAHLQAAAVAALRRRLLVRADDVTTGVPEVGAGHVTDGAVVVVDVARVPRRLDGGTSGR